MDGAGHTLELDLADIGKGNGGLVGGVHHGLADQDLPRAGVFGDP